MSNGNSSIDINVIGLDGKSTVLFSNNDAIIIGLNNKPFALFASSDFKLSELPLDLSNQISSLSRMLLKSELNKKNVKEPKTLPDWLLKFTSVDYLTLNDIKILSLQTLNLPKLRYLVLNDVSFEDRAVIISEFHIFKSLEYLVHNDIFTSSEIALIKKSSPNIKVMSEYDFNKEIGDGEVAIN
ncbi:hypothetical protein FA047_20340 [Pedobacter frigoris]|uniref:Uncharacterized protein n=2 Tax=Pedobacter frigoris TaxID=2571272 RepID=A0A4V5P0R3_9SPHI|nr:hypothetical protein FA047_20340 [Pedobacter frigoris]